MTLRPHAVRTALFLVPFAAFAALIAGCSADADDSDETADATTTHTLQAQSEIDLFDETNVTDEPSATASPAPEEAARIFSERASLELQPEGCATKKRDGNVVVVTASGCTARSGKRALNGTLTATFTKPAADTLHVDLTGERMTANDHALSYASQIDIRYEAGERTLTYHGRSSGKTARGRDYTRTTDLTAQRERATSCTVMDGASRGTIGRYDVDVTLTAFRTCPDACPTNGVARASVHGPLIKDATVTVTFDGTDETKVHVDARKQRNLVVALDCTSAEPASSGEPTP